MIFCVFFEKNYILFGMLSTRCRRPSKQQSGSYSKWTPDLHVWKHRPLLLLLFGQGLLNPGDLPLLSQPELLLLHPLHLASSLTLPLLSTDSLLTHQSQTSGSSWQSPHIPLKMSKLSSQSMLARPSCTSHCPLTPACGCLNGVSNSDTSRIRCAYMLHTCRHLQELETNFYGDASLHGYKAKVRQWTDIELLSHTTLTDGFFAESMVVSYRKAQHGLRTGRLHPSSPSLKIVSARQSESGIDFSHSTPTVPGAATSSSRSDEPSWLLATPRIATWNARGLYCDSPVLRKRKMRCLDKICASADIVLVQETHGEFHDVHGQHLGFLACWNEHTYPSRGGVMTLVSEAWLGTGDFSFRKVVLGRISCHTFSCPSCKFTLYNVHLEDELHSANGRVELVRVLANDIERHDGCVLVGGDLNYDVDLESDPPHSHRAIERAMAQHLPGWTRISPPQPTYVGSVSSLPRCLDAFLVMDCCSAVEASGLVASIVAEVHLQQPMLSDHLPVLLHTPRKRFCPFPSLAAALSESTQWVERVTQLYSLDCMGLRPLEQYKLFVKSAHLAAHEARASPCSIPEHLIELNLYYLRVAQRYLLHGQLPSLTKLCARAPHWHLDPSSREVGEQLATAIAKWRERRARGQRTASSIHCFTLPCMC